MSSLPNKNSTKTIEEIFTEYINECRFVKGLRPATTTNLKYVFGLFLRMVPEVVYVDDLNQSMVVTFFTRLQTRERNIGDGVTRSGVRNSTVHTYARKLKSFFKWLVQKQYLKVNPLNGLEFTLPEYSDDRALSGKEIEKIIAAIYVHSRDRFVLKRDIAIIHVLSLCGIRRGELLGLRVQDVDFVNRILTVRKETSKSKITRLLPMNSRLVIAVEAYMLERKKLGTTHPELFLSNDTKSPLTINAMRYWVSRLSKHSGVKFHLHRFRHSFACALEKRNVTATKIQKLMGHKDITMTMKYLRSTHAQDLRQEMDSLNIDNLL